MQYGTVNTVTWQEEAGSVQCPTALQHKRRCSACSPHRSHGTISKGEYKKQAHSQQFYTENYTSSGKALGATSAENPSLGLTPTVCALSSACEPNQDNQCPLLTRVPPTTILQHRAPDAVLTNTSSWKSQHCRTLTPSRLAKIWHKNTQEPPLSRNFDLAFSLLQPVSFQVLMTKAGARH